VLVLSLLALGQVLAPRLAASSLRDHLARSGEVEHVEVHAFPALELIGGRADRVVVRMRSYRGAPGQVAGELGKSAKAGDLDFSTGTLSAGPLTLRDATLRKRGSQLTAEGRVTEADLRAALPPGFDVKPISADANGLVLEGTATVLGVTARLQARVHAVGGGIVVEPQGALAGVATLTVFADRRIEVQGVGARGVAGGFEVTVRGRLR
jgi:hypothetical protein